MEEQEAGPGREEDGEGSRFAVRDGILDESVRVWSKGRGVETDCL